MLAPASLAVMLVLYRSARGRIDAAKTRIGEYAAQARAAERERDQDPRG